MTEKTIRIAADIGGTFTDLQIMDLGSGAIHDFKSPTTPHDPAVGLLGALTAAAKKFDFALGDIAMLLHGSTIATNAVLERKLPEGALITNQGFTDVLEIGRHMRHNVYALKAEPRSLLIPRQRRYGVAGRVLADGSIETPLDAEAVGAIGEKLVQDGITTVAIMFLHAYRNPVHEQQAAEILSKIPDLQVSTSHEVSPEIREFERVSTTVLNALLKPVISGYLERLSHQLTSAGVSAKLFLVQSNGGVASPQEAARLPVKLLLSGPAGGALAMASLAKIHDIKNMVGIDMGGTSSDVSVVVGGKVGETGEGNIDGLPVRSPMIEIRTIGAGGGSIAYSSNDAMRVGPRSAGSQPGPACYQRGGKEPTVTDANLQLGRVDPGAFLGGEMQLSKNAAETAVASLGSQLKLTVDQTAAGIVEVANASMAGAVRLSLFEKGADPSDFVLAPFGGAGGLHACAIARELEIDRIIFPATASTLSARGILNSDLRHDLSHSELLLASGKITERLGEIVSSLHDQAVAALDADGVTPDKRKILISADCRYRGQAYEINTPCSALSRDTPIDAASITTLTDSFHQLHQRQYAHSAPGDPVEIVTIRAAAVGLLDRPQATEQATPATDAPVASRPVNLDGKWRDTPIFHRSAIGPKAVEGPLLIEEAYSVLLIEPGWKVHALGNENLIATRTTGSTT